MASTSVSAAISKGENTAKGQSVLLVDDDVRLLASLSRALTLHGFEVDSEPSAGAAMSALAKKAFDVIVLDVAMPGMDGLTLCSLIRRQWGTPIIMLTARDEIPDRVAGLEAGADDYLTKPFALDELVARLNALVRRSAAASSQSNDSTYEGISLNGRTWRVTFRGLPLGLTATEFLLLRALIAEPEKVFSRDELLKAAWSHEDTVESNAVDVHISNLRRKLEEVSGQRFIRTVRRAGYALRAE